MPGIFISYRRQDSAPYAGRLYDRLSARFGEETVFMDVDDIKPGANFVSLIDEKIASCDALVAVIGKRWLSSTDNGGESRLRSSEDFVRLEIETALRRKIIVIPALVSGAEMPAAQDLPETMADLAQRQAIELTDKDFAHDVDQLIEALKKVPGLTNASGLAGSVERKRRVMRAAAWKLALAFLVLALIGSWQWQRSRPANFAGLWEAQVNYSWGGSFKEEFDLKTDGDKLFGTASFLGVKRGIQGGRISGGQIAFSVRFQSMSGSELTEHEVQYTGKISGDEIRFVMQDDRGYPPVEFVAKRNDRPA
jgi:TIR domain